MVMKRAVAYITEVDKKSLQANKIKEIGQALVVSGFACLDQQANALGVSRSTAWAILNFKHKTSGLTAVVINQMLMAEQLPPLVRAKLFEYIEDKIAGTYGHSPEQARRFASRLAAAGLRSNSKTRLASFSRERRVARACQCPCCGPHATLRVALPQVVENAGS
jgi:hypothetical protein